MQFPQYPTPRSYNNIPSGHPVEINASFNVLGEFRPRMFRIEMNYERNIFRIKSVDAIKENGNTLSFYCSYEAYGQRRMVVLKFDIKEHRWYVG